MQMQQFRWLAPLAAISWTLAAQEAAAPPQPQPVKLTLAQREEFLANAKIVRTRSASKGITGTLRATLSDGKVTHDASIQTIDEAKTQFQAATGGTEFNFRDTYRYNIAAYRLDKMLDLHMIPATVDRRFEGKSGSFTWWVDDVLMDEEKRYKEKIDTPDKEKWNMQMHLVRVFDQLIFNIDRNLGNLLIDKGWNIWMIDHTRAFRLHTKVKEEKNLVKCEKGLIERLRKLDQASLKTAMTGGILTDGEIKGLLGRRDHIVKHFEKAGDKAYYEMPMRAAE